MAAWMAAASLIAAAAVAAVRSARDRFWFGALFGAAIALLAIVERAGWASFTATIGAAAALATAAVVLTVRRERHIPAARAQERDLLYPFLACAGIAVGDFAILMLARPCRSRSADRCRRRPAVRLPSGDHVDG